METLSLPCSSTRLSIEAVPVNQVKELRNKLLKGKTQIKDLEYQKGKGWHHNRQKISTHELDAYLVYWLWENKAKDKQKTKPTNKTISTTKSKAKSKQIDIEEELPWDDDLPEDETIYYYGPEEDDLPEEEEEPIEETEDYE